MQNLLNKLSMKISNSPYVDVDIPCEIGNGGSQVIYGTVSISLPTAPSLSVTVKVAVWIPSSS